MISFQSSINQGNQDQEAALSANDAISDQLGAFFALWQEHQPYLYHCCLRWMGSKMDAEDALSQVMLKAAACFKANSVVDTRAWFGCLAHNHCMDLHRQRQRGPANVALDEVEEQQLISVEPLPAQVVKMQEMTLYVNWAIDALPAAISQDAFFMPLLLKKMV